MQRAKQIGRLLRRDLAQAGARRPRCRRRDLLYATRTPDAIKLTRYDPEFDQALGAARDFMRRYPNFMKKLAEG